MGRLMAAGQPLGASCPLPAPGAGRLSLRLLGGFEVWLGARRVAAQAFPRRKAINLLKLLALQPGYQLHREQVLDLLWPDLAPRAARAQLYKAIRHVRQAFESAQPDFPADELIQVGGELVKLSAPDGVHTDIESFEALARRALRTGDLATVRGAAASYSGDLLPAAVYEPWAAERRRVLREQAIEVFIELGERYLAAGRFYEAAWALQQALDRDRAREAAHRALMLVFARQGRRTRALRQYQICVSALAGELGVMVSSDTAALYHAILLDEIPALKRASFELPD